MKTFKLTAAAAAIALGTAATGGDVGTAHAEGWFNVEQPWLIRVRGIGVLPDEDADIDAIGGDVDISNEIVPEIDFTYFVHENVAFELIAATAKHDVEAEDTAIGDHDLGEIWLLPPTLLVQYHHQFGETVKPYVGAGVNYTIFYNGQDPNGAVNDVEYDNSFGWALQAGVDFIIDEHWVANIDVKKLWLNTDVELNNAIDADVDIDPWIVGAGFGYRF